MLNFDEIIERKGTSCLKYDFALERGLPEDVLPFWVADMDFRTPQGVIDELVYRSWHQVIVIADEIHQDFVREGFHHTVFAGLSPEIDDITITCTSPSKEYNRVLPFERFNHETQEPYALGKIAEREAVLIFNRRTMLTEENTIEYFI